MSETQSATAAPVDTSAEAVSRRVDSVIHDVIEGRLTKPQRKAPRDVCDRGDRVSQKSDDAVRGIVLG